MYNRVSRALVVLFPFATMTSHDDDDGDDDDDDHTNLYLSTLCSFYSYVPHLPSLSPSFTIPLMVISIS